MKMINHTLGPLTAKKAEGGNDWAIVDSVDKVIGEAFYQVDFDAYRSAEGNARLWAKAPRLLEALENLLRTRTTQHRIGLWPERFPGLKDRPTSFNRFKIWLTRATVAVIEAEDDARAAIEAAREG